MRACSCCSSWLAASSSQVLDQVPHNGYASSSICQSTLASSHTPSHFFGLHTSPFLTPHPPPLNTPSSQFPSSASLPFSPPSIRKCLNGGVIEAKGAEVRVRGGGEVEHEPGHDNEGEEHHSTRAPSSRHHHQHPQQHHRRLG
ncbi:unnamed protein product [Closterium sp. NIES-53]